MVQELIKINWQIKFDNVQPYWNCFESKLIEKVDKIAPFELEKVSGSSHKLTPPSHIKNKINKRARLLKNVTQTPPPPFKLDMKLKP